jgi:hypothetical protein
MKAVSLSTRAWKERLGIRIHAFKRLLNTGIWTAAMQQSLSAAGGAEILPLVKNMTMSQIGVRWRYGWIPHNASFGFLDLAPSILHSDWFWDYIS